MRGIAVRLFVLGVFLLLTVPLVFSQVCGDSVCGENESVSCPSDCFDDGLIAPAPDDIAIEEELKALEKSSDSSSLMLKVIIFGFIFVILGVVGFFIYRKVKKDSGSSEGSISIQSPPTQSPPVENLSQANVV